MNPIENEVGQALARLTAAKVIQKPGPCWWVEYPEQPTALGERSLFHVYVARDPDTATDMVHVSMPDSYSEALKDGQAEEVTEANAAGVAQRLLRSMFGVSQASAEREVGIMGEVDVLDVTNPRPWDAASLKESGRGNPVLLLTRWALHLVVQKLGGLLLGVDHGLQAPAVDRIDLLVPVDPMANTEVTHLTVRVMRNTEVGEVWQGVVNMPLRDAARLGTDHTLWYAEESSMVEAYTKALAWARKWDGNVEG